MNSDYREPLNIGSDEMVTIDEPGDIAIELSGKTFTKKYYVMQPQGVRGRNSDNTMIQEILGWSPSGKLRKGMAKTYPWIALQVEAQRSSAKSI